MSSGHWEVVGKPSKIPKKGSVANGTKPKRDVSSSMPRIATSDPVKESPTIYDAFIEKDKSSIPVRKDDRLAKGDAISKPKGGTPVKKKVPSTEQRPVKKLTIQEVVSKIEYGKVLAVLEKDQTTFPDNPTVWLMDLATFINCNFDSVSEPDPFFEGKPKDYPLSLFPKKLQGLFEGVIKQCSESTQKAFLETCIKSMINDMGKGVSTYGFRMVIQLLARLKPKILATELQKYLDLIKLNQNRPLRCLSIMWAVGQVGHHDLQQGLTVWFELMVPFLNIRSLAGYVVDYLISLCKMQKPDSNKDVKISCNNFFPIFDIMFNPPSTLSGHLQKKLLTVYPQIKGLALKKSAKTHQVFFPSFLARLKKDCKPAMRKEVSACLVECLQSKSRCHPVWRQMYMQHQEQTGELFKHICVNWESLRQQLDRGLLKETVGAFIVTNNDLATNGNVNAEVTAVCEELQRKLLSTQRGVWGKMICFAVMLIVGIPTALFITDVITHDHIYDTKTWTFLTKHGVLEFLFRVYVKIMLYITLVRMWLTDNAPYYYAKVADVVGPYLVLFWQKLCSCVVYMGEVTEPYRLWLADRALYCLEWMSVQLPWILEYSSYYAGVVRGYVLHYSLLAWQYIQHYSFIVGAWLQENVFTGKWSMENIGHTVMLTLQQLRSYILTAFQYGINLIQGTPTS